MRMVKRVKEELRHEIIQAQWLSGTMKTVLTQKLDTLETQIGYPEWYKDDVAVTRYYRGVIIT